MSAFPIPPETLAAYPVVNALAAKLAKKQKWTVGRENYLLINFAAMLLVLGRQADLERLGTWLHEEHPFRGNFNIWEGIAYAQGVCAAGCAPVHRPVLWAPIHRHYAPQTAALRAAKMDDGEQSLIHLDETRASARTAVPKLGRVLGAQVFTWVLLQDPAAEKKFRAFDRNRLDALIADASARLRRALEA